MNDPVFYTQPIPRDADIPMSIFGPKGFLDGTLKSDTQAKRRLREYFRAYGFRSIPRNVVLTVLERIGTYPVGAIMYTFIQVRPALKGKDKGRWVIPVPGSQIQVVVQSSSRRNARR